MFKKLLGSLIVMLTLFTSAVSNAKPAPILYTLTAGDTISITVYGEENLSIEELKIDNRETVDYPYLGRIKLGGKTLEQLQLEITDGLKGNVLINPKVNVSIVQYRNIYVNGLVNKPGGYEYEPALTVQEAISLAGGVLTKYRRSAKVYLTSAGEYEGYTSEQLTKAFESDTENEVALYQKIQPGDTLHVIGSFW
ncbi:polysaccharide export protein [Vibrio sp. 1CM2L]|uniref:polysaccharide biosynthesis/export family protein n=1 Tax=Vibrio TaxID=662 RepID=UPI0006312AB7|nr:MULTISPECIES: polysaccharide biosynthesis/export family protein [Vibrio]MCK8071273.1 polysaccharide export protein [Vibrio sp. 1CM23M]MCK8077184.1 polysaccharide export protein [Vibrio sp. 1CM2L]CDT89284.1 putative polysaccharide biosynthesis/export protein [Vibrio coralliirubri]